MGTFDCEIAEDSESEESDGTPTIQVAKSFGSRTSPMKHSSAISIKDDFDFVSERFSQAIQFDGSVSFSTLSKMLRDLPKKPDDTCEEDLWATLIFLAYFTLQGKNSDECWKLTLDKTEKWISGKHLTTERFKALYEAAIVAVKPDCI